MKAYLIVIKKRRFENYNNIYVKRLEDILEDEKKDKKAIKKIPILSCIN